MEQHNRNTQLTRETAWWFIPKEHVTALRKLEDRLNDLVYTNGILSREEALETLKNELSRKDRENAKKILDHFIRFYEKSNNILNVTEGNGLVLRIKCELVGTYSEDFANARIIFEKLFENRNSCVGKYFLYSTMNDFINPENKITKWDSAKQKDKKLNLYRYQFREAINILKTLKLAEQVEKTEENTNVEKIDTRIKGVYKLAQEFLDAISNDEVETIHDKAIQKLRSLRLKSKSKGNTATKKKEIKKILEAREYITQRVDSIPIKSSSDRTLFHWFSVFLIMKYAHVDTSRVLDDIITYIRYNNIKFTPIPVTEKKLSRWEESYVCWNAFEKLLVEETSIPITWSLSIPEEDYIDATSRLINDITDVLSSFDSHIKNITKDKGDVITSLIEWIEEIKFSLLYVRATIELNSSHNDALGHLENLFKIITQKQGVKNCYDLCLVVFKLNRLACEDTFEYSSKAKKWIYTFNNIPECADSFDAQNVVVDIYLHLIGMTSDEKINEKYRRKCFDLIRGLKVTSGNINGLLEVTTQKYLYLLYSIDNLTYKEVSTLLFDLWGNIEDLFSRTDSADPRPVILKYDTFIIAAKYLHKYMDFGFSLPLLTISSYIHLKELGIKNHINYYYLLEGFAEFIEQFDQEIALRVKMQIESEYPNKLYIDREIAIQLFDMGCFYIAFDYAKKAEDFFYQYNLADIEGCAYYIDVRVSQINALFLLGEEDKAKEILLECGRKLSELDELYPEKDKSCILQGVIDHYNNIKSEFDKRPFYSRELRLDYILVAIDHMVNKSNALEDFYEKWRRFSDMYISHKEFIDKALQEEFESAQFPIILENISSDVVFSSPEFDLSPIEDEEIKQLKKMLEKSYELYQRSFLLNDDNEDMAVDSKLPFEKPSCDMLFKILQPETNCKIFLAWQKARTSKGAKSEDYTTVEELEKYHYIVMSDCSSVDDALEAANLFMQRIEFAIDATYAREMAAEVFCEQSNLIDFNNWSEKEKLLNQAEYYIVNKDGSIISDKAKDIYIRIQRRLYDVYDYQERSDLQASLFIDNALDFIKYNNIRSVDAAYLLGERGEYLFYENKNHLDINTLSEVNNLIRQAIDILVAIFPQTDASRHYLELYREFLSETLLYSSN